MKTRDIAKGISDALKNGNLVVKQEIGNGLKEVTPTPSKCSICGKKINDVLDDYAYLVINDDDMDDIIEKDFCSKECWKKFVQKINK